MKIKMIKMGKMSLALLLLFAMTSTMFFAAPVPVSTPVSQPAVVNMPIEETSHLEQVMQSLGLTPSVAPSNRPKYDDLLASYIETGTPSEKIYTVGDKVGVILSVRPDANLDSIKQYLQVRWIINLKVAYLVVGWVDSPHDIVMLSKNPSIGLINADPVPEQEPMAAPPSEGVDSFYVREILDVNPVSATYNGTGATIAIADTGVDFGLTDLAPAYAHDASGHPIAFDPSGYGIVLTNHVFNSTWQIKDGSKTYLNISGYDDVEGIYTSTRGYLHPWYYYAFVYHHYGYVSDAFYANFTGLPFAQPYNVTGIPSASDYHFGIAMIREDDASFLIRYAPILVVNSTGSGYDTIYVDWDGAYAMSLMWYGEMFGLWNWSDPTVVNMFKGLFDYSFVGEPAYTFNQGHDILAIDLYGNGINDFSLGALGNVYDAHGYVTGGIVNGIDPNGNAVGIFYEAGGTHGTGCAVDAAGRGLTPFNLYGNGTGYYLPGIANGAELTGTVVISGGTDVGALAWMCGFDLNTTTGIWEYTGNHKVDVISNSWGYSAISLGGQMPEFSWYDLYIDVMSMPGFVDPSYPGTLFVFATGNGGPGYGTVTAPGSSAAALSVGASTATHVWADFYGEKYTHDNVIPWSNRGPTFSGYVKPDVVAVGAYAYSEYPLWYGFYTLAQYGYPYFDGRYTYTVFGGTSQATPYAAGAAAVVIGALKDAGKTFDPWKVKTILKSTAKDLGYDPFIQGAGQIDVARAVALAIGNTTDVHGNEVFEIYSFNAYKTIAQQIDSVVSKIFMGDKEANNLTAAHHPGISINWGDTAVYAGLQNPGDLYQATLNVAQGDGSAIGSTAATTGELVLDKVYTTTITTKMDNSTGTPTGWAYRIRDIFNDTVDTNLENAKFAAIYLSYSYSTLTQLAEYPYTFLFAWNDTNGNGKIDFEVYNSTTHTVTQVGEVARISSGTSDGNVLAMYAQHPGIYTADGSNLTLYVRDKNFEKVANWTGIQLSVSIMIYKEQAANWISVARDTTNPNTWHVNVTAPNDIGVHIGYIKFSEGGATQIVPVSVNVMASVSLSGATSFGGASSKTPYDLYGVYGVYDWSWRPETGDFRVFAFNVTQPVEWIKVKVSWEYSATKLDTYVFNSLGSLVAISPVNYVSGGKYNSGSTMDKANVLFAHISGAGVYYVVLHSTALDGSKVPELFNIELAATNSSLVPQLVWKVTDSSANTVTVSDGDTVSGDHLVVSATWTNPGVTGFTEADVVSSKIEILSGAYVVRQGYTHASPDSNWPPAKTSLVYEAINLTEGDVLKLSVSWTTSADLDVFLFAPGTDLTSGDASDDLLGYAMATGNNPETATYTVKETGTYYVGINLYAGPQTYYTMIADTLKGFENVTTANIASIDSYIMGKNGTYMLKAYGTTNSNLKYDSLNYPSALLTLTLNNYFNPKVSISSPVAGQTYNNNMTITYTISDVNKYETYTAFVSYSPDGGKSWFPITAKHHDSAGTYSVTFDVSKLTTSDNFLVRVRVEDSTGLLSNIAIVGPMTAGGQAPPAPGPTFDWMMIGIISIIGAVAVVIILAVIFKKK